MIGIQTLFLTKQQTHVSLYTKFNLLQEMLDDYSPKDHREESNDILERRIRDAAYRLQEIIESPIPTPLLPHVHLEKGVNRARRHLGSTFRKPLNYIMEKIYFPDLEKVDAEVDSILEELIRIKKESSTVHEDLHPNSYSSVEASRVQAPSGKNTKLVFDEDLMRTIKAQLCGESSKLEVISIAGMGGLGKTTLARNVFDDRLIHDRFDCRAWVTISQNYDLVTILLAMVESLGVNQRELDEVGEEVLQRRIYQNLFGRRYLIVMDDVWEARFWDDIRRIFPDNSNGSRVVITTRLSDVIDYVCSSKFHHQMQFLDEDQSWTLLREKAFAAQEQCPEELEVIGKKIAKNCRGLPLAIVVIVGVLSNVKRAQHDWKDIARKAGVTLPPIPYDEVRIIHGVPLLGSLQTLSKIGHFIFTRDTIEMIPNLKKLGLRCDCKASQKWEGHGLSNLVHLHQLETLYISFFGFSWGGIPLPENFAFPSTLIKLSLEDSKLPWKDMSVVGSLPNLQVLKLRTHAFLGEEWEPIEGEFLKLKFLLMENLPDLKYWRAENTHFPCLEHLHIRYCNALEVIPPGIGDIPTLQLIQLNLGSALESSALEIQEQQWDLGNDDLQVRVSDY